MAGSFVPGDVIGFRYRLEKLLGEGGVGQVWRAEHLTLCCSVALKLMLPKSDVEGMNTRLLREARATAALHNPHVVRIFDYGVHQARAPYVVMELLEGQTLADRLDRLSGPLAPEETCRIMTHVARALGCAHQQGMVHRDLKPENIFLALAGDPMQSDGEEPEIAKVLDFGIAKLNDRLAKGISKATKVGRLLGTPNYMSPEQALAEGDVDYRTDLWSMAMIAFECVTGRMAFEEPMLGPLLVSIMNGPLPVPSSVADVPPGFDEWFEQNARRDREQRAVSAVAVARSLRGVLLSPPNSQRSPRSQSGVFGGMMGLGIKRR